MSYCPSCGEESKGSSKFCKNCGSPLSAQETAVEETATVKETPATTPKITESRPATPVGQTISGIHVSSNFVKWPSNLVNISFIERVSTSIPKTPFPKLALLVLLIGIAMIFSMPPLGIVVLIVGIAWIAFWVFKIINAPKGITIYLNSGNTTSILLSDHTVADGIASSIRRAIDGEDVEFHVDVKNVKTVDLLSKFNIFGN